MQTYNFHNMSFVEEGDQPNHSNIRVGLKNVLLTTAVCGQTKYFHWLTWWIFKLLPSFFLFFSRWSPDSFFEVRGVSLRRDKKKKKLLIVSFNEAPLAQRKVFSRRNVDPVYLAQCVGDFNIVWLRLCCQAQAVSVGVGVWVGGLA